MVELVKTEKQTRTCSCGRLCTLEKEKATKNDDGYWTDCECESTLFWPNEKTTLKIKLHKERKNHNERVAREYKLKKV